MQTTINISPAILNWVIANQQVNENSKSLLNLWLTGDKKPTFNQVEKMSKETGIPFGYFFLKNPPIENLSFVEYRTIDSIELQSPSRNLKDLFYNMEQVQEWTRNHLIAEGEDVLPFVGYFSSALPFKEFAKNIRELLGLELYWGQQAKSSENAFKILKSAISNIGVIVMMNGIVGNNTRRSLNIEEFRAFTLIDLYAPLIFINSNDSITARIFSLLHEFVHICLGKNSLFNDRYTNKKINPTETLCNSVAAEIIIPTEIFFDEWKKTSIIETKDSTIQKISKKFNCSVIVVARKAFDNKYITKDEYNFIVQNVIQQYRFKQLRNKELKKSGGDYYRTLESKIDNRFLKMLMNSINEGKTLYSDAFRLTNTNRLTFSKLIDRINGTIQ